MSSYKGTFWSTDVTVPAVGGGLKKIPDWSWPIITMFLGVEEQRAWRQCELASVDFRKTLCLPVGLLSGRKRSMGSLFMKSFSSTSNGMNSLQTLKYFIVEIDTTTH